VAKGFLSVSLDKMSKSLLAQATQRIKSMTEAGKRVRAENRTEETILVGGAGSLALAVGAAYLDKKHGKDGGPHKVLGVPTAAIAGLAIAGPALAIKKFPGRIAVAMSGISLVSNAAYRYTLDKVKDD
jgi:hypothetical protein